MIERSQNANTFFSIEGDFTHRSTRISKDGRKHKCIGVLVYATDG